MEKYIKFLLPFFVIIFLVFFAYRSFFSKSSLVWGDAPFFYMSGFKNLVQEPSSWISRGNSFGGVNRFLWISPIMILYGSLGAFHFSNELLIRIFFYWPGLLLSILGIFFLGKRTQLSRLASLLAVALYTLNTYPLLLADGGQSGIFLAWGLFPIVFLGSWLLSSNFIQPSFRSSLFWILLFSLTIIDFRIAIILFCFIFLYWFLLSDPRSFRILIFAPLIGLCSLYFLYPSLRISSSSLSISVSSLEFTSLLNGLFLYQPHWPINQYGHISYPSPIFVLLFFLVIAGVLSQPKRQWIVVLLLFLLSAFLIKGTTPPLGFFYSYLIEKVPFGVIFRDSTKFFIPLTLFASLLFGYTFDILKQRFTPHKHIIFSFLLLLLVSSVWQAYSPGLSGALSLKKSSNQFSVFSEILGTDMNYGRSVWIPYLHPLTFHTSIHPSIDGRDLQRFVPFRLASQGEDPYNFFFQIPLKDWFKFLSIRYLIFSGYAQNIPPSQSELVDQSKLYSTTLPLGSIFSRYPVALDLGSNTISQLYSVNKLYLIVGKPDLTLSPIDYPQIYAEDGIFDPTMLLEKHKDALVVVLQNRTLKDLAMVFLQKHFIDLSLNSSAWAIGKHDDYLHWKYQLLTKNILFSDLDFGRGIIFSTQANEENSYNVNLGVDGQYLFAVRSLSSADSLFVRIDSEEFSVPASSSLVWNYFDITLSKGSHTVTFKNTKNYSIVNAAALLFKTDFDTAYASAQALTTKFHTIRLPDNVHLSDAESVHLTPIEIKDSTEWKMSFQVPTTGYWILFRDSYHPLWSLKRGGEFYTSIPLFSSVNAFYFEPNWSNTSILFLGQYYFRWGLYLSSLVVLLIVIVVLSKYAKKD